MDAKLETVGGETVVVLSLKLPELYVLAASVNEAIEEVEDWEFSARVGVEKDIARDIRRHLQDALSTLPMP